jgi:hypothetical protein
VASPTLHDFAGDIQSLRVACSAASPREFATTSAQKNLFYSYGVCLISLNLFTNMNTLSATCSRNRILMPKGMLPKLLKFLTICVNQDSVWSLQWVISLRGYQSLHNFAWEGDKSIKGLNLATVIYTTVVVSRLLW